MCQTYPVSASDRVSFLYLEHARIDLEDGSVWVCDDEGELVLPSGRLLLLLLGPGVSITHAAVEKLASDGCLLHWVGEHGVRLYATSHPRADAQALLEQAGVRLDPVQRLGAARRVWTLMFGEDPPLRASVAQLRGLEGSRVKPWLAELASQAGAAWCGRRGGASDPTNRAIDIANSTLYGISEAAILALGYSPAIGFVHDGDPRSFVFDLADTVKFRTVVPLAMRIAAQNPTDLERRVRIGCRNLFIETGTIKQLVQNTRVIIRGGIDVRSDNA